MVPVIALLVLGYTAVIQFYLKMMHWTVDHEQHSYSEILRKIYTLSISSCVPYWFYCLYVC